MGKILGKRQLILATLILALGTAVFVNWYYTKPERIDDVLGGEDSSIEDQVDVNPGDVQFTGNEADENIKEYFANAKLNREAVHDQAMATLQKLASSIDSKEAVASASLSLEKFSQTLKQEADIEALVSAKTGSESVAIINGEKIEVVVDAKTLDENAVVQITDIVLKNTDISADNITIIGAK